MDVGTILLVWTTLTLNNGGPPTSLVEPKLPLKGGIPIVAAPVPPFGVVTAAAP